MSFNQRGERYRVKNEEDRTKNSALWNAEGKTSRGVQVMSLSHHTNYTVSCWQFRKCTNPLRNRTTNRATYAYRSFKDSRFKKTLLSQNDKFNTSPVTVSHKLRTCLLLAFHKVYQSFKKSNCEACGVVYNDVTRSEKRVTKSLRRPRDKWRKHHLCHVYQYLLLLMLSHCRASMI